MKQVLLPIGGAILMIAISITLNRSVEIGGILLAGLIGLGVGLALNHIFSKVKKGAEKTESK